MVSMTGTTLLAVLVALAQSAVHAGIATRGSAEGCQRSGVQEEASGVQVGTRPSDSIRGELAKDPDSPFLRHELADALADEEDYEEALDLYLWCFDCGDEDPKRGYGSVRVSSLATDLFQLAQKHPPTGDALRQRRDAALDDMLWIHWSERGLENFVALNRALGETAQTLRIAYATPSSELIDAVLYMSRSGACVVRVSPTDNPRSGAAEYSLLRDGTHVWKKMFPLTFAEVIVDESGRFFGYGRTVKDGAARPVHKWDRGVSLVRAAAWESVGWGDESRHLPASGAPPDRRRLGEPAPDGRDRVPR